MSSREDFKSFIPANKSIPELTAKALIVGAVLAVILGAANAYLGLYAGMTVSAVIPGAVMAFAFLRPFKGTILEVNIGMMGAAAGEALAAGIIFTIPALVLLGTWTEIQYLETTIIALLGGLLGVLWMVPLRKALITKTDLPFPEGVAVAAVLTTTVGGEEASETKASGSGVSGTWLVVGVLIAALFKFGQVALNAFRGAIHGITNIGTYNIGGSQAVTLEELWKIFKHNFPKAIRNKLNMLECDQKHNLADTQKAYDYFGWKPKFKVKDEINKIYESEK